MANKALDNTGYKTLYIYTEEEKQIIETMKKEAWQAKSNTGAITIALHSWPELQKAKKELQETKEKLYAMMQKMQAIQDSYSSFNKLLKGK